MQRIDALKKTLCGAPVRSSLAHPGQLRRFMQIAVFYLAFWIAAWQAASFLENRVGVSLWFLPAGMRFVCLLVLGRRGLLLELVAQLTGALYMSAGAVLPDGLGAQDTLWLLYAWLAPVAAYAAVVFPLRRILRKKWDLTRPAHVALFLVAALAASTLSAVAGCLRLYCTGAITDEQLPQVVIDWLTGDLTGILTLAPLLLLRVWPRLRHYLRSGRFNRRRRQRPGRLAIDRHVVLVVVPALLLLFALPWQQNTAQHSPIIALLLLLPLVWVAMRFGLRGTVLAVALLDGGLVLLMALFDQHGQALYYQLVMIAIALVGLWLGTSVDRYVRAEASRSESETSFRATFEQAAVGIAMISNTGHCLQANERLCAILAYTREELLGKTFQQLMHPDELASTLDIGRRLLNGGASSSLETRFVRRDGSAVWVRLTASLVHRGQDKPDYFVAVIEDIQSRKEAESALQVSEGALKEAQRLAGLGNWTWRPGHGNVLWSEQINHVFGRQPDAPPPDDGEMQSYFSPADWHLLQRAGECCLGSGTPFACDVEVLRGDGARRWITIRGEAVRAADATIVALRGTVQDTNELKLAEQALRELNASLEQNVARRTAQLCEALQESMATRQRLQVEIDQRRQTEQRLHEVQMTLDHATRIAALGAWSVELRDIDVPASNPMTWSHEMYRLLDYSPQEVPRPTLDLMLARVHLADLPMFTVDAVHELVAKGGWQREFRIIVGGGRERLVSESAEVLFDAAGKPFMVRGATRDISLQRQAEKRLRNSEASLQMALKGASAGSFEWDFAGGINRCSAELGALYGLPSDIPPASYASWCRAVHPDDLERVRPQVDEAIARGLEYEVEWQVNAAPDSAPRWMISRACPLRSGNGLVSGYLGLSIDISERKRNEIRLQQYRDDLKGMVAEQTEQLVVANSEQRRLNRALRLLSDCNVTLAHAEDEQQLLSDLCRLVVESGGYLMGSVWFANEDAHKSVLPVAQYGSEVRPIVSWDSERSIGHGPTGTAIRTGTIQICADCQNDPRVAPWREMLIAANCRSIVALPLTIDKHVIGAFALYSERPTTADDEEMKVLEELASNLSYGLQSLRARNELVEHQRLLEQRVAERTQEIATLNVDLAAKARDAESANRAKSSFLSTMSHEIRTPLNAIVGLTGLLADSPLNNRQHDYADKIRSAAQNLHALIDDILDFSKIEAGALKLDSAPFSLDAILSSLAVVVSAGTAGKPIEVLFDVAADIPEWLVGDALRVQQILVNLAGNAAKFTERGEIVVAVRRLAAADGQVTLEFAVRDSGIGIAEEHQQRIFDAFDQGNSSTSRRYGGTGLGLAISARLAALMGSQITLSSQPGQGSEFRFAVTLAIAKAAPAPAEPCALPRLRLLIVDDHALARSLLAQTCTTFGWSATAVDSAAAGLAELRRSNAEGKDYDALLLDWHMPDCDGIEMLRRAQAASDIGLPLVILMVATFELEQAVSASDGVYIDSLLAKPTTPASLFDAVTRAHSGELVSSALARARDNPSLDGMRLLVAEDNDLNQLYVEQILTRAGAEVTVVDNGVAAVDALRSPNAHFDAVLMDLEMPQMGGYAATRIIREELGRRDLPIIAVTAYAQTEDYERSRQAGMNGHLVKPIDENDLLGILADERRQAVGSAAPCPPAPAEPEPSALVAELADAGIDGVAALRAFGGDKAKYCELLRRFVADHRDDVDAARRLFEAGDVRAAASLIHGICGMASIVHAQEMAHLARATEEAIGHWDSVPPLFDELQGAMRVLSLAVEQTASVADSD